MLYPIELWAQMFWLRRLSCILFFGEFLLSAHSLPKWTARARKIYHVPSRASKVHRDHLERLGTEEVRGQVRVVLGRGRRRVAYSAKTRCRARNGQTSNGDFADQGDADGPGCALAGMDQDASARRADLSAQQARPSCAA